MDNEYLGNNLNTEIKITDKTLMMIFLLEECNFSCVHCVREDEPMSPGYKLSFDQLRMCLSDCSNLQSIKWVHFSGGEPTLWTDGKRDLVDLLLEISKSDFTPGFTTNGSSFLDYKRCHDFFTRNVEGSNKPLRLYLSIDTFHDNFDVGTGRAQSLDNVIKCKQELRHEKGELLDIRVVVVVSRDSKSLLPDEMIEHYDSLGVTFLFTPLGLKGRAKSLRHLCPDLKSDNPEDLGAYQRFHRKAESKKLDNIEGREKVSNIVLIGDDYYYCVDNDQDFRDRWHKVGRLGHLSKKIIDAYNKDAK